MGLLSALLRWNELDPPSGPEQLRNDRVCSLYQHNRNPFVDHPEYANLIWRNPPAESSPFTGKTQKAWINEFHYENKGKDENEVPHLPVHHIFLECLFSLVCLCHPWLAWTSYILSTCRCLPFIWLIHMSQCLKTKYRQTDDAFNHRDHTWRN